MDWDILDANGNYDLSWLQADLLAAYNWLLNGYRLAIPYLMDHQQTVLMVSTVVAFILLVHWWDTKYERRRKWNLRRGKAMNEEERAIYLNSLMADIICEGIEDAIHDGKMSEQEARKRYTQFAKEFGLKDLKSKNQKGEQKKLKSLLAKKWWNGHRKPKEAAPKQTKLVLKPRVSL